MKIAIIGTRSPTISYEDWLSLLLSNVDMSTVTEIISGGARGIDRYAKRVAKAYNIPLTEYLPEYSIYGRAAALIRNIDIVKSADMVIAFPSQTSRGTHHAILQAKKYNIPVIIVNI